MILVDVRVLTERHRSADERSCRKGDHNQLTPVFASAQGKLDGWRCLCGQCMSPPISGRLDP